jgi:hemerythrin superfamily protein
MDALHLLTADHNRVRGLFTRFRAAEEAKDTAEMALLAEQISSELEVHTSIEEEIFYPAVDVGEIHGTVAESLEEHHVVKVLLGEIASLTPDDDAWTAKMKVLIENVEHHAEEEESQMFPQVRKQLAAGRLDELGESLETRKAEFGAATAADKEHLTTEELKKLAGEQQIPGRSSMNREELLATVALP